MKPLIIIPTYCEEENIKKIIESIYNILNIHILVVDDNSDDNTRSIVRNLMNKFSNIYMLERDSKKGLASAYIDGFKFGIKNGFDVFIELDADLSHNPNYLPIFLNYLDRYDVIIGSRNVKGGGVLGWPFYRNLISKGGSLYSKIILNCPINDMTGGYNVWKKEVLDAIGIDNIISNGYCFQIEMKYRAYKKGFKIKEYPIIFEDRKYGKSKMSKAIFTEALLNIIKIRFLA